MVFISLVQQNDPEGKMGSQKNLSSCNESVTGERNTIKNQIGW